MAHRIATKDWSATTVGPRSEWPEALQTAVNMLLVAPQGMIVLWGPELVQIYNDGYRDVLGNKHPEALGQRNRDCWPEVWDFVRPIYDRVLQGEVVRLTEQHLILHRNGVPEDAWFDLTYSPLELAHGRAGGILASVEERSDRIRAEQALRASERRLATAIEASAGGVFEYLVPMQDELYLSPRWCEILGYRGPPVPAADFERWMHEQIHPRDREARHLAFGAFLNGETPGYEMELRIRHASDGWVWIREFAQAIERGSDGRVVRLSGMILDITQRKAAESRVEYVAHHDHLTGLANRMLFTTRLDEALSRSDMAGNSTGLMLLDLDRFKIVNDTLGHPVGDELLRIVARRIRLSIRHGDTVARIGGDEFAVVLPGVRSPAEVENLARRICKNIVQPARVEGRTLDVATSIGVATYPADGADSEILMRHADLALYSAKQSGRKNLCVFKKRLATAARRRARIETDLRGAIEHNGLVLHYQPQFDLATGAVRCVEALVRWKRDGSRLTLPNDFIDVAEASGVIRSLGGWVLREACRQQAEWQERGLRHTMAVNVSPAETGTEGFSASIDKALEATGISGSSLELEITEGLLVEDDPQVQEFLATCEARGIALALDDFGTGYSSLGYLGRLPVAKIKIDRTFVAKIGSKYDDTLIEAIVHFGHRLGKRVVAEGVETEEQLGHLKEVGCDDVQGHLLCPPAAAKSLTRILQNGCAL